MASVRREESLLLLETLKPVSDRVQKLASQPDAPGFSETGVELTSLSALLPAPFLRDMTTLSDVENLE